MAPAILDGLVIAHLGKSLAVEDADGRTFICHSRRQVGDIAVGDRVGWEPVDHDTGVIVEVQARRSALVRPARGGRLRIVASNLDRVWIVVAREPEPDFLLVDQILAVCEHRDIDAGLLLNKVDLPHSRETLGAALAGYAEAGYPVLDVSAREAAGLDLLREALQDRSSMLAGQSGVGKSSLTRALLPDKAVRTNELSRKSRQGRHTTTTATLYHLPEGGQIIDSPGVTVFGLAGMSRGDIGWGFREFQALRGRCRFNDCAHLQDKDCAIRSAVEQGTIPRERYDRYRRLLEKAASPSFASQSAEG